MAKLKTKDIKLMNKKDQDKKILELKAELIKSKSNAGKNGKSNSKEIKRTIARILTIKE
jgi:ribosomal protein L29